ncbi:hypothetical protein BVRB_006720 [Beta vulgaris subsp. vulgaris]|uniref:Uncharacterized protein n=1 Tax=Beta vulgaris subsp. vulgaris TaxID=3555 RepID=A0A0J8B6Q4_BETVV|nr:hypothetical protein BVRB_006720 [Beta vulgaris subsp. vulgaris]
MTLNNRVLDDFAQLIVAGNAMMNLICEIHEFHEVLLIYQAFAK